MRKKKVEIEDLGLISFLSEARYNPSGTKLAFVKTMADIEKNCYNSEIHILDQKSGKVTKLTSGKKESSYRWLDNETIVFTGRESKDDEKRKGEEFTVFSRISINGGEADRAFEIPVRSGLFEVIDDNTIIFTATQLQGRKPLYKLKDDDRKKEIEAREEEKDYEVFEEIPFWSNGGGFTSKKRSVLYTYDIRKNEITPLTSDDRNVQGFELNEKKDRVLIIWNVNNGMMELSNMVSIMDLKTKEEKKLNLPASARNYDAEFFDDDRLFILINEMKEYGENENASFHLYDLKTDELVKTVEDQDITVGTSVNSDMRYGGGTDLTCKNGYIWYAETNDSDAMLKRMNAEGDPEILIEEPGSVDFFAVSEKGDVTVCMMKKSSLQELYSLKNGELRQLTHFNDEYLKSRIIAEPETIRLRGEGDDIVKGFVLKPANYKKGKKYPGILVIHGGPKTVYGEVFIHEMQIWSSRGYFVFFCNPKGSDGKGNEFADIRGRYGTVDYDNLMDFCDRVLDEYPDIDENNLCVTGGSYGGFMTNWILGHNFKFRCAVSQRSISNWLSFFGTSDIGYFFTKDQNAGDPWNNFEKLWEHSPLKYADKAVTPTLFIHSSEDYRCWTPEGFQMFTALKYHGVEARLCLFKGETHELSRSGKPKHRIRRLREMTDWFEKYTK